VKIIAVSQLRLSRIFYKEHTAGTFDVAGVAGDDELQNKARVGTFTNQVH
jgi:hypothetical protein